MHYGIYDIINGMETQTKTSAKDVFINLGAIIALYTLVISLVNLLFTVINHAYPQITSGYNYLGSSSISWPVATLVIFFPIFILLMWLLEKDFNINPEKQTTGIHKWLAYLTLFISGIAIAADLITVLYYFIDGQELSTAFLLKILVLLILATAIFAYYLSDIRGKLTANSRKIYRITAFIIIIASIVWGFSVLGSPRSQRLLKYDEQKVNDLMSIKSSVENFYSNKGILPKDFNDLSASNYYVSQTDSQTNQPYEYVVTGKLAYELCAVFNTATPPASKPNVYMRPIGYESWDHALGRHCFTETINPNMYLNPPQQIKY